MIANLLFGAWCEGAGKQAGFDFEASKIHKEE